MLWLILYMNKQPLVIPYPPSDNVFLWRHLSAADMICWFCTLVLCTGPHTVDYLQGTCCVSSHPLFQLPYSSAALSSSLLCKPKFDLFSSTSNIRHPYRSPFDHLTFMLLMLHPFYPTIESWPTLIEFKNGRSNLLPMPGLFTSLLVMG